MVEHNLFNSREWHAGCSNYRPCSVRIVMWEVV